MSLIDFFNFVAYRYKRFSFALRALRRELPETKLINKRLTIRRLF